jgi:hypothetical protein
LRAVHVEGVHFVLVSAVDRLLALLASLKLAIVVILSLAFYLGVATFYEARFGGPAVQRMIYGSPVFISILAMLAINVAAAVIVRYPWKRKQTGFIITHIGIEVLLVGCVLSLRQSVDGRVVLRPGETVDHMDLLDERIGVVWGNSDKPMHRAWRADWWDRSGYPGAFGFLLGHTPETSRQTPVARYELGKDVRLTVDEWLPAARFVSTFQPSDKGHPAVQLHLHGTTPNGMEQDQQLWLHSSVIDGAVAQLFGGVIEATLHTASDPAQVEQFLTPIDVRTLGASGRLSLFVDGKWETLNVADSLAKDVTVGNGGVARIEQYLPNVSDDGQTLVNLDETPTNPALVVKLKSGAASDTYVVSARYPFKTRRVVSSTASSAKPAPMVFDHPAIVQTQAAGTRGRIQFLQGPDQQLYLRQFGLRGFMNAQPVKLGDDYPAFMGLKIAAAAHLPRATRIEEYVRQNAPAKKMGETMRAARVTLEVGSESHQAWLARGAAPKTIETAQGPILLSYAFDSSALPFSLSLQEAKMTRDPGSDNPAAYESHVVAVTEDGRSEARVVSMNEPATIEGLTFYQQGFNDEIEGGPLSQLSVRRDPGWIVKYAGCALIVGGIFTMFYMKAYFQKPAAAAVRKDEPIELGAGAPAFEGSV